MLRWTSDQPTGEFRTVLSLGGWKGVGEVYLELLVSSPLVSTNSLEAGAVSRLRVLGRHHVCRQ